MDAWNISKILLFCLLILLILNLTFSAPQHENSQQNSQKNVPLRYRNETIDAFMKWCVDHGVEFPSGDIQLKVIPGFGLGIISQSPLKKNDLYMKIPHSLMMGVDLIEKDPDVGHVFKSLNAKYGQTPKYEIIFYLLYQKLVKKDQSFWWPYLNMLPDNFNACPFFWGKELELLKGSHLYDETIQERMRYRNTYDNLKKRIMQPYAQYFPPSLITYKEFMWAEWIYSSRLFYIDALSPRENLVPLADFVNCEEPSYIDHSLEFVTSVGHHLELRADRAFTKNAQVFESYGAKSNSESLKYEGFVNMKAPNDCIWLDLPWKEEMKDAYKQNLLTCLGASHLKSGKWPYNALQYLRYYVMDSKTRKNFNIQNLSRPVSSDNEKMVWLLLKEIILQYDKKNPFKVSQLPNLEKRREKLTEAGYLARLFRIWEKMQTTNMLKIIESRLKRKFDEL